VPILGSCIKWRCTVLVGSVDICSVRDQQFGDLVFAKNSCVYERRRALLLVTTIYVRAFCKEMRATAAFLKSYPWQFRLLPVLRKDMKALLGSEYGVPDSAMGFVNI